MNGTHSPTAIQTPGAPAGVWVAAGHGDRAPERLFPPGVVAVIGAGGFGRFCIDAYAQAGDIQVAAIVDPRFVGEVIRESLPPVVADWHTVLRDPSIEALHLVTPPFLRGAIVQEALRAGKSVLCEKPLALSMDEAAAMLRTAEETSRNIGINYVLRHHPAFDVLYSLAGSGAFGALRTISLQNFAQKLPDDHWMWDERQSGGILVEHGVHFFDAYGHLAGAPINVRAGIPHPHAVECTVTYESGAVGTYFHEFAYPPAVERTRAIVFFDHGYVEIDGWIPERLEGAVLCESDRFDHLAESLDLQRDDQSGQAHRFHREFGDRQAAYVVSVVAGMRDTIARHRDRSHEMTVSIEDARESLALALAGQRAAHTGRVERVSMEAG